MGKEQTKTRAGSAEGSRLLSSWAADSKGHLHLLMFTDNNHLLCCLDGHHHVPFEQGEVPLMNTYRELSPSFFATRAKVLLDTPGFLKQGSLSALSDICMLKMVFRSIV